MKERLLADLDDRIARHAGGDSSGVLDEQALVLVSALARLGAPDAGSLVRVAALHLCRYQALQPADGGIDLRMARILYTRLHAVDPRLVTPRVREFFGLPSPHASGLARLREYEQTGDLDHLERAISLFRQEVLEPHGEPGAAPHSLGVALLRRYERTRRAPDLEEAIDCGRAAVAATPADDPRRARYEANLAEALSRKAGADD
jgi:hypothetical protein